MKRVVHPLAWVAAAAFPALVAGSARGDELPQLPPPPPTAAPPPLPPPADPLIAPPIPATGAPPLPSDPGGAPTRDGDKADKEGRTTYFAELGYSFREVDLRPAHGADLRFGIGAQDNRFAGAAFLEVFVGRTLAGLGAREFKGGALGEWRLGALRLGLGADLGYTFIDRKTVEYTMYSAVLGLFAQGSYDVLSSGPRGDHALYIAGRFNTNFMWYVFEFGPTVSLGYRY